MSNAYGMRLAAAVVGGSLALCSTAHAGGFAIREQSASSQGASFAGSAAGFDLSSMYWNPAAVTAKSGVNSETHAAIILGQQDLTATGGTLDKPAFGSATSGNIADPAALAASYANYQFGNFYIGLSVNTPFGLTTKPENDWRGQAIGQTSELLTVNAAPTVGYKVAPGVSVAVGAQVQYIDARLTSIVPTLGSLEVEGDDWGFGFTAGILLEPTSSTKIGLGFRSSVSHTLEGDQSSNVGSSSIEADVDLPELVTLSLHQQVTQRFAFLGTVEWTNWSRVKSLDIKCTSAGGACPGSGSTLSSLELNYEDGWFFAGGIEYAYSPDLTLRTGLAYEISPAREDTSRSVRIADNDRIWASLGATYNWSANTSLDFAYTHIFVKDGGTDQSTPTGLSLTADVDSSVDILSASLKIKW
ncbi:MAG: transporter [Hyphomicrobiaceae bacterium]